MSTAPHWQNVVSSDPHHQGFTLPELLVTLTLMFILLSQLIPNLSASTSHNTLYSAATDFTQQLQLARNSAIQRNRKVTLCKSDLESQCNTAAEWESGWILFENLDGDGRIDSGDTILHRHNSLPELVTLRGVGNFKNRITYTPTGDSTSFSRLVLCEQNQLVGSQLIYINSTGRIRIAPDNDGDGIPETSSGDNIESCEL